MAQDENMTQNDDQNIEAQRAWNTNAAFWNERMADGNDFFNALVWPAVERLLQPLEGDRLLDVACGNGLTSRRLAQAKAKVTAFDFSEAMINFAKQQNGQCAVTDESPCLQFSAVGLAYSGRQVTYTRTGGTDTISTTTYDLNGIMSPNGGLLANRVGPGIVDAGSSQYIDWVGTYATLSCQNNVPDCFVVPADDPVVPNWTAFNPFAINPHPELQEARLPLPFFDDTFLTIYVDGVALTQTNIERKVSINPSTPFSLRPTTVCYVVPNENCP
jgi:SAM-dependent methyltransferase